MSNKPPMAVWKFRFMSPEWPWSWTCHICTAHDFHRTWAQAMQGAEVHWNSHWVRGRNNVMTLQALVDGTLDS